MGGYNRYNRTKVKPYVFGVNSTYPFFELDAMIKQYGINQLDRIARELIDEYGPPSSDYPYLSLANDLESKYGIHKGSIKRALDF